MHIRTLLVILPIVFSICWCEPTGDITVVLEGVKNVNGRLRLCLFTEGAGFPGRFSAAARTINGPKDTLQTRFTFTGVPFGVYAVAVLHDENDNRRMDFSGPLVRRPREGYGVSNNIKGRFSPPSFGPSSFIFDSQTREINIKIIYP